MADDSTLFAHLQALELKLQAEATRNDRNTLDELLHPDFVEIGRSGTRYDRTATLITLSAGPSPGAMRSENFQCSLLGTGVVLMTYMSSVSHEQTRLAVARASVWLETDQGWKLRYHQATPILVPGQTEG